MNQRINPIGSGQIAPPPLLADMPPVVVEEHSKDYKRRYLLSLVLFLVSLPTCALGCAFGRAGAPLFVAAALMALGGIGWQCVNRFRHWWERG